jgi:hypothetical protein
MVMEMRDIINIVTEDTKPRIKHDGEVAKNPTSASQYRDEIISYMQHSGELARRAETPSKNNPDCLPEISLDYAPDGNARSKRVMPPRKWKAAQEMVRKGEAVITRGSFEENSVFLVAGPNFPN